MSFSHKAFAFSWQPFVEELAPLLTQALALVDTPALEAFIARHINACTSPYDGEPLSVQWRELLEVGTVQELADFALTKYYKPTQDFGLGEDWAEIEATLLEAQRAALLGTTVGAEGKLFDPGLQGSYFQSPKTVQQSVALLSQVQHAGVMEFSQHLRQLATSGKGLYVTF
jgi:hypothetical protein